MKPIVNSRSRPYQSRLREEQAQSTHDRILDATARVLAGGFASVSIPAIAREAGVSVPTVYRIFGTKRGLLDAIYPYAIRRARTGDLRLPTSIEDYRDGVRTIFERLESFDEIDRAAIASRGAEEVRHSSMDARLAVSRKVAETIAPDLSVEDREHLARIGILLTMSASARMLRDHLGLSLEEAVDEVDWAIRAVIAGRSRREMP
jgi:AcrR family transcriptional regulator